MEEARLWPEALLQVGRSYGRVPSVDELAARGLLLPETAQIFRNERGEPFFLYQQQVEAMELGRRGEAYVPTSGTGSGKSLSHVLPIVDCASPATSSACSTKRRRGNWANTAPAVSNCEFGTECDERLQTLRESLRRWGEYRARSLVRRR